jgi:predicted enzyme related to lactoylglutathione lyase
MNRLLNWIEIPVTDLERACAFYERILVTRLERLRQGGCTYAVFPTSDRFNAGALVQGPGYAPSSVGARVYLDGGPDLAAILHRVRQAGGTVLLEKTFLSDLAGHVGMFVDTEGNTIGLQHP